VAAKVPEVVIVRDIVCDSEVDVVMVELMVSVADGVFVRVFVMVGTADLDAVLVLDKVGLILGLGVFVADWELAGVIVDVIEDVCVAEDVTDLVVVMVNVMVGVIEGVCVAEGVID
jgi:hypothetical protein